MRDLLDPRMRDDLLDALAGCWGQRGEVVDVQQLGARVSRTLCVVLEFDGEAARRSVIVKHVHPAFYGPAALSTAPAEFFEEAAAYEFFAGLTPPFPLAARRLAFHPHGLLVLEYITADDGLRWTLPQYGAAAGKTLALLHAATIGRTGEYAAVRQTLGLGVDDRRSFGGAAATIRDVEQGGEAIADWSEALGIAGKEDVRRAIDAVRSRMEAPSARDALLHDDLTNERQCIIRNGELHLLDFENCSVGRPLRDVAKAMLGKFEVELETGLLNWGPPGFGAELPAAYRRALAAAGGPQWSDDQWAADWRDALLHGAIALIGSLHEAAKSEPMQESVPDNMAFIADWLARLLPVGGGETILPDVINSLAARAFTSR